MVGKQTGRRKEGGGEVYEKWFEIRYFRVSLYPEEPKLASSWAAEVGPDEKMKGKGFPGGGWMYNRCWPGWQNGNSGSKR